MLAAIATPWPPLWTARPTIPYITRLTRLLPSRLGTPFDGKTPLETLIATAREPHLASTFNYASMAHNNHFFFSGLSKTGGQDKSEHMSENLKNHLERSFGSLESLRRELIMTADAMFGPGFVWVVQHMDAPGAVARPFKILTTYQAGSPYPTAHWRNQGVDMNNHGGAREGGAIVKEYFDRQNVANRREPLHGSGADTSSVTRIPPGGTNVVPVLCVNTWEHAWMFQYGIGGKTEYVSNWWNIINWGWVESLSRIDSIYRMSASPKVGAGPVIGEAPAPTPSATESTLGGPQ